MQKFCHELHLYEIFGKPQLDAGFRRNARLAYNSYMRFKLKVQLKTVQKLISLAEPLLSLLGPCKLWCVTRKGEPVGLSPKR